MVMVVVTATALMIGMPAIAIGVIVIVINGRSFAYLRRPGYHYGGTNANAGQRWQRYPEIQPNSGLRSRSGSD